MEDDGTLVIDLRKPDWAGSADSILRDFASEPPKALVFEANDAAAPNAEEAQLIYALTKFANAADINVSLNGLAEELTAGLDRVGLSNVFAPEGDSAP